MFLIMLTESLNLARYRVAQLELISSILRSETAILAQASKTFALEKIDVIFCGDFNLDCVRHYNLQEMSTKQLEYLQIPIFFPSFADIWPALYGNERGLTWDHDRNRMMAYTSVEGYPEPKLRLDHMLITKDMNRLPRDHESYWNPEWSCHYLDDPNNSSNPSNPNDNKQNVSLNKDDSEETQVNIIDDDKLHRDHVNRATIAKEHDDNKTVLFTRGGRQVIEMKILGRNPLPESLELKAKLNSNDPMNPVAGTSAAVGSKNIAHDLNKQSGREVLETLAPFSPEQRPIHISDHFGLLIRLKDSFT